jgi:hypothetical protein
VASGLTANDKKDSRMMRGNEIGVRRDSQMATIGVLSVNKLTFGLAILAERTSDRFSDHIHFVTRQSSRPSGSR